MQQRPPRIATANPRGSAGNINSLPSTPQPLASPAIGVPTGPGSGTRNRNNIRGHVQNNGNSNAAPPSYGQQNHQSGIVPTPNSGRQMFSHRRISSFLNASGFKKTSNDVSVQQADPQQESSQSGTTHKRQNSLWSPNAWSSMLTGHGNTGKDDENPTPGSEGQQHPGHLNGHRSLSQNSNASVPFHQPPPSYGSSGKLVHQLEPSPSVQRAAVDYFNTAGAVVVNEHPEHTQPHVNIPNSANIPRGNNNSMTPKNGGTLGRMTSVSRINEFQKASGFRALNQNYDANETDPNFLTKWSKPDPQHKQPLPSAFVIRIIVIINIGVSVAYMYWRINNTITNIEGYFFGFTWAPVQIWGWIFYAVECCLIIAIWIGHTQRLFAVTRPKINMDMLVREDDSVGYNSRVAILLPTNGETLEIVMKALLGNLSLRNWDTTIERCASQRIIILDEKRRKGVLNICAAVYALATILRHPNVISILQAEGVQAITSKGFYDWWKTGGGYARKHLYNDHFLNQACRLLEYMEEETSNEAVALSVFGLEELPAGVKGKHEVSRTNKKTTQASANSMLQAMNVGNVNIEPGYVQTFNTNVALPTLIYYTRRDCGTPKVSPKAGNMNAAIFSLDYPDMPPLIGNSTIVVVNDCRHQLQPEFLQRTVPYFFELDGEQKKYRWAPVAFVQTPQRFDTTKMAHDPLGNHAAVQYDIINHGKDGIGAVSSSGQGSLWRVAALKGVDATGKTYADPSHRGLIGHKLGFRSEMLIEDTHTSIDMFRHGWTSRYVNEPGEHLSMCTHQPNNINWRIKQVLRWHQGAVQLLFFKGITFTCWGGNFPTVFHRIYAFDQATYYLQAIPGYMLLLMPIIYGIAGEPPFNTKVGEFFLFFTPFIVTAMLPTVISGSWRGVDSNKLTRDEQVWLSTTYVQIYAFLTMLWQQIRCRGGDDAWAVKAPTWPLFAVFCGEFIAIIGAIFWVGREGYTDWSANFISVVVSASLAINALWPMVSLQMGWNIPSLYYLKLGAWLVIGTFIVLVYYIST
mmetsp:Transcript_4432/g.6276  ORF Transcript_4432/g.6276 Transcript_4432/m.6276 type:complete len:1027 (+) Transcript_4432:159-3239(+)|eukprot:CAMPEP_0171462734 /NCGR_PEP_ID=MMETSP0945-20130129/6648_1 /TAXON_ID=109269 /ORGANISM="Vaucheria litorea, Strain CCMP2940" /LENGTH=1026 /DNA_ID=CAMNT_0011989309 /DNA_START=112 /DNA_END=3192 /DNA_ORIENTATION=-